MKTHLTPEEERIRFKLLNLEYDPDYEYDTISFEGLTYENYLELLNRDLLDPHEQQNDSPEFCEMANFCYHHPDFTMFGYVVTPNRLDCRITCEGVEATTDLSKTTLIDFIDMFRGADKFKVTNDYVIAWYD